MSIKTYLYRCPKENSILLFWLIINSACLWANGILSARALTSLVALEFQTFFLTCLGIFLVYLLWSLQIQQVNHWRERAIQAIDTELRKDIAQALSYADSQTFQKETPETYASWLTNDVATINDLGFEVLEYMIMQGMNALIGALTLLRFHPTFAVTLIFFAALMQLVPKVFQKAIEEKALLFTKKQEALLAQITDVLEGFQALLTANRLFVLPQKIEEASHNFAKSKIDYSTTFGHFMVTQNLLSMASQIAILTQAGYLFSRGLVPVGAVTSSQYFASTIFTSLTGFLANASELKSCQPIFEKFAALPNQKSEEEQIVLKQANIDVVDLSFSYENQPIFQNLNLAFQAGQKYAITGPSGRGKSTLLKLLAGELQASNGLIRYGEQAMSKLSQHNINSFLTYLPQTAYLFQESLAFNLTLGAPLEEERVLSLFNKLALTDWFTSLPHGFDTILDGQCRPSGGQAQKICLIRALLLDKPFLLLDESLSAIDPTSRQAIEDYLHSLDTTLIHVSHQLEPIHSQNYQIINLTV
ncbi:ATP-binding cassette domain-containing protein [Streptococcus cameli]